MAAHIRRICKAVLGECLQVVEAVLRYWPGLVGQALRSAYYRRRLKHLGRGARIGLDVLITGPEFVSIGANTDLASGTRIGAGPLDTGSAETHRGVNPAFGATEGEVVIGKCVHIGPDCYLLGHGGIAIADNCGLAGGCRILSASNHYASLADPSNREMYFTAYAGREHAVYIISPVVLQRNVGVASNAVVLPGATLSRDCFVAIGSVVHRGTTEPNTVVKGNPARVVKNRFQVPSSGG